MMRPEGFLMYDVGHRLGVRVWDQKELLNVFSSLVFALIVDGGWNNERHTHLPILVRVHRIVGTALE